MQRKRAGRKNPALPSVCAWLSASSIRDCNRPARHPRRAFPVSHRRPPPRKIPSTLSSPRYPTMGILPPRSDPVPWARSNPWFRANHPAALPNVHVHLSRLLFLTPGRNGVYLPGPDKALIYLMIFTLRQGGLQGTRLSTVSVEMTVGHFLLW